MNYFSIEIFWKIANKWCDLFKIQVFSCSIREYNGVLKAGLDTLGVNILNWDRVFPLPHLTRGFIQNEFRLPDWLLALLLLNSHIFCLTFLTLPSRFFHLYRPKLVRSSSAGLANQGRFQVLVCQLYPQSKQPALCIWFGTLVSLIGWWQLLWVAGFHSEEVGSI